MRATYSQSTVSLNETDGLMKRNIERQLKLTEGIDVQVLQPLSRMSGGRLVAESPYGPLYSNEELVSRRQAYPGQALPSPPGRTRWPVPDKVAAYCSEKEFASLPKFMAQWVHWPKRTKLVLEGRYHELPPSHFEGIFTLVCNFACPHCSRRVTRTQWVEGEAWGNNVEVEKKNTMHPEGLKRVIDQMATFSTDNQMGIVWGGGDPTASPFTYDAMAYARSVGISASFLTNGVFMDVDRVLDAEPILVRVSLNCGTAESPTFPRLSGPLELLRESQGQDA